MCIRDRAEHSVVHAGDRRRLRLPLVWPDGWVRTAWMEAVLGARIYCGITLGYRWGYGELEDTGAAWLLLDVISDLVFMLDLLLSFRLPFRRGVNLVTQPLDIAARYLFSRTFLTDLLSTLPLFLSLATGYQQPMFRLPALLQVLRTPWLLSLIHI